MENFIYILIGIVWVAYSLYSARQKAIQKQQSTGLPPQGPSQSSPLPIPGNQQGGKSLLDDIFRELTGEPIPIQQVTKPIETSKPLNQKNVSELNVAHEGHQGYKFTSTVPTHSEEIATKNPQKSHQINDQNFLKEDLFQKFNLREAVIYSELLKRKYF